jgi:chromosome segregation ATPase
MSRGKENNPSSDMQKHRMKHQLAAVVSRNQALRDEDELLSERLQGLQKTQWALESKENALRTLKTNLSARCTTVDQKFQKTLEDHTKAKQAEIAVLQRKGAELEARLKKVGDDEQRAETERGELLAKISEVLDSHRNAESEDAALETLEEDESETLDKFHKADGKVVFSEEELAAFQKEDEELEALVEALKMQEVAAMEQLKLNQARKLDIIAKMNELGNLKKTHEDSLVEATNQIEKFTKDNAALEKKRLAMDAKVDDVSLKLKNSQSEFQALIEAGSKLESLHTALLARIQ